MAEPTHEIQEAPELAALGSPDVASGDLPIGLRALIDAGVDLVLVPISFLPDGGSRWPARPSIGMG